MMKSMQDTFNSADAYISMALGLAVVLVIGTLIYNFASHKTAPTKQVAEQTQQATPTAQPTSTEQVQTQQTAPAAPQMVGDTYTVQRGESLWTIAVKQYNNGFEWKKIAQANNLKNNTLTVGQKLTIPTQVAMATPAATQGKGEISAASTEIPSTNMQAASAVRSYTVVHGDSLWSIAVKQYGNGARWTDIAKANHLANPRVIHSGNVLILP